MEFFIVKYKLETEGWEYLKTLFPKTIIDIIEWENSCTTVYYFKSVPVHTKYHDRILYDYFDAVRINITLLRQFGSFTAYVDGEKCFLNKQYGFHDRGLADICGFINAMNIREIELNKK